MIEREQRGTKKGEIEKDEREEIKEKGKRANKGVKEDWWQQKEKYWRKKESRKVKKGQKERQEREKR